MSKRLKDAESGEFTVKAGAQLDLDYAGVFVRCLESTGILKVALNHGGKSFFERGIARRLSDELDENGNPQEFESITLYNDSAADIDLTLSWGYGDIEDGRLSLGGTLSVTPDDRFKFNGNYLKVDDLISAQALVIQKGGNHWGSYLTKGYTDISGASYAMAVNTTTTVVTAAANTGGIILRLAQISGYANAISYIAAGAGNYVMYNAKTNQAGSQVSLQAENIIIPAGVDLVIHSGRADVSTNIVYEVL